MLRIRLGTNYIPRHNCEALERVHGVKTQGFFLCLFFLMSVWTILFNSFAILTERMPLKFPFNSIFHFFSSTVIKYKFKFNIN